MKDIRNWLIGRKIGAQTLNSCALAVTLALAAGASSATVVDLTSISSSGTINGAIFQTPTSIVSGTGLIDPFLRIQMNGTESGYNTDAGPQPPLDAKAGTWTHSITVGDLQTNKLAINGITYYQFALDINQNTGGDSNFLSLHELEFYLGNAPDPTAIDGLGTGLGSSIGTLVYDMDSGVDSRVELDYDNFPGSGRLDMFVMVPTAVFGSDLSKYVYLYSAFGTPNASNDGFEEWSRKSTGFFDCVDCGPPPTDLPEPGSALLAGLALIGLGAARKLRRS